MPNTKKGSKPSVGQAKFLGHARMDGQSVVLERPCGSTNCLKILDTAV